MVENHWLILVLVTSGVFASAGVECHFVLLSRYAFCSADSVTKGEENIQEDSDVAAERRRINSTPISTLTSTGKFRLHAIYGFEL